MNLKIKKSGSFSTIILLLTNILGCSEQNHVITLETLLREMTDRDRIANFPSPSYICKQFSSYDRETVSPDDRGWFANRDCSQFIRVEENRGRKEYVLMDADGPGAIVRFWMTFPGDHSGKGTMRIYFDGRETPCIEGTPFEIISGGLLSAAPLSSSVSELNAYENRGHNLYVPLPYAKHCKITYESEHNVGPFAENGDELIYYNINYRCYQPGTEVVTFSMTELKGAEETLHKVLQILKNPEKGINKEDHTESIISGTVRQGEFIEKVISGEGAIRRFSIQINAEKYEQALRSTLLEIWFDGRMTVWCPVGDFFGTGYQIRPYRTWYSSARADGLLSVSWIMPFQKSCKIRIRNMGEQAVNIIRAEIVSGPWEWNNESMYFGASWHQYTNISTGTPDGQSRPLDINYTTLEGKGVYVGDAITIFNSEYAWWGEGDEKIYVDGETFPSHMGTGTEDYYGYAMCASAIFNNHPFISQPDGSGNNAPGYSVNLRYRCLDAIPFTKSLRFDMELYHWRDAIMNYAPVSFWYIRPRGKCMVPPDVGGVKSDVILNLEEFIPQ